MRRGTIDPPTMDELRCLNGYPEGTVEYTQEDQLITQMRELCILHGFGRVEQLMSAIEEIWRDPEAVKKWQELREERMEILAKSAKYLKDIGKP